MPHFKRPKIGLIFTGGGIAARRDSDTLKLLGRYDFNKWMLEVSEIGLIAEIQPINLFSIGSHDIKTNHWLKIAESIYKNIKKCDGFVVTHGLDTIVYTAAAVSFLLKDLGKPVVFTGSRFPPNLDEANNMLIGRKDIYKNTLGGIEAKSNLINAVQAATMDIGEVCVLFGNKLLRANRTSTVDLFGPNIFDSGEVKPIGEVNFGLELYEHRFRRDSGKKTKLIRKIKEKVAYLKLFPQIESRFIESLVEQGYKAIIIEPFFTGEFPSHLGDVLKKITEEGVILVAACSSFQGSIDFSLYDGGQMGNDLEMISGFDMTPEAVLTKLTVILGEETNRKKIKKLMHKNWAGEISPIC